MVSKPNQAINIHIRWLSISVVSTYGGPTVHHRKPECHDTTRLLSTTVLYKRHLWLNQILLRCKQVALLTQTSFVIMQNSQQRLGCCSSNCSHNEVNTHNDCCRGSASLALTMNRGKNIENTQPLEHTHTTVMFRSHVTYPQNNTHKAIKN